MVGLYTLGTRWGITGVAVVVDGVLLIGLVWLLGRARAHVDFSARRLFGAPAVALLAGAAAALGAPWLACRLSPGLCSSVWLLGGLKMAGFAGVYVGLLLALEGREALNLAREMRSAMGGSR